MTTRIQLFDRLVRYETDLWNAVDRALTLAGGVSLAQVKVMRIVAEREGLGRVQDISAHLGVTVGAASKLVDRLERDAWAVRSAHPDDRRSSRITLTLAGERELDAGTAVVERMLASLMDVHPETLESLETTLEALQNELDEASR